MSLDVSLVGLEPTPRYDSVPWTQARILGAPDVNGVAGTYVVRQTVDLDPVDTDPADPIARNITVNVDPGDGWVRVVFLTADGGEDLPTDRKIHADPDLVVAGLRVSELKRYLDKELSTDDDLLRTFLLAAFDQAQAPPPNGCGRLLLPDPTSDSDEPVAKTLHVTGRSVLIPDAREITEVLADGTATTDYVTLSQNDHIVLLRLPARGTTEVTITGRFGFATLPPALRDATYVLAARYFYELGAMFADQVVVGDGGSAQAYYRQLPPRTKLAFSNLWVPGGLGGLA